LWFSCDLCISDKISYLLSVYHFNFKLYLQRSELSRAPGVFLCLLNCSHYTLEFFLFNCSRYTLEIFQYIFEQNLHVMTVNSVIQFMKSLTPEAHGGEEGNCLQITMCCCASSWGMYGHNWGSKEIVNLKPYTCFASFFKDKMQNFLFI